ncbi:M3 family metallopeptidase [Streptosporangium sp. NBC_01639]|uniref:M3 family metallopeptidase n=1 Tax=Streptosporangium sp. NBC_01639 TaxID=2975948 RepID=UPI00386503F0|nr:M3 family metallopeptidase [Streptosporangium sp. NBC_01639]
MTAHHPHPIGKKGDPIPLEATNPPEQESLDATDDALNAMMIRLREIVGEPDLTQDAFVEVASIYNNVAYVFLYLESNEKSIDYSRILHWKDAFHQDSELDVRLAVMLEKLRCADPAAEESRVAYVKYLRNKGKEDPAGNEEMEALHAEAKSVVDKTRLDQLRFLDRLGVKAGRGNPATTFYRLAGATENEETRTKLTLAMTKIRDRRMESLIGVVDRMIAARRAQSRSRGYPSVLAQTLERCGISEATADAHLTGYLARAMESHQGLAAEIREKAGGCGDPMDHFGYYVRTLQGGRKVPLFPLEECMEYIFSVAHRIFELTMERVASISPHVLTVSVRRDEEVVGHINFDLWDSENKKIRANHTRGIRNRTDWKGLVQRPVAYVSCRFQRDSGGTERITFQNVHSLFHEFGHALNHLMIRKHLPNQSGLEYLPLERLENLSMWFEKWVYHPDFADHLSLSGDEREGLKLCQHIKMLEYRRSHVDRAVTSALDFEVHRRSGVGVAEAFHRLDERFGISRFCGLGDFPAYFTWPMFQANPGANFAYLWGSADSAMKFAPFMDLRISELPGSAEFQDMFSGCFDFDEPSTEPDIATVFRFYDDPHFARA